jgi:hypothetical protein
MNIVKLLRKRAAGGGASPLLNGLVAYWKLDETSGTRFDSVDTNNLTDNGSVGYAIGKIGNAASFVAANSEYLSTSPLLGGTAWTISLWLKIRSSPSTRYAVFGEFNAGGFTRHYCYVIATRQLQLDEFPPSGTDPSSLTPTVLALDTWYHIVVVQTAPGSRKLYLNTNEEATNSEVYTGAAPDELRFGGRVNASGDYANTDMDEIGIWDRALSAAEITALYNSGAGITYPFV